MKCPCNVCGKTFSNIKSMTNHRRWHDLPQYRKFQEIYKRRISKANLGEQNGMWKGDKVSYGALHNWIKSHKTKPKLCECCKNKISFDIANIGGKYKRDLNDWEWLCRRCHMIKDGRINNKDKKGRFKNKEGGKH